MTKRASASTVQFDSLKKDLLKAFKKIMSLDVSLAIWKEFMKKMIFYTVILTAIIGVLFTVLYLNGTLETPYHGIIYTLALSGMGSGILSAFALHYALKNFAEEKKPKAVAKTKSKIIKVEGGAPIIKIKPKKGVKLAADGISVEPTLAIPH